MTQPSSLSLETDSLDSRVSFSASASQAFNALAN